MYWQGSGTGEEERWQVSKVNMSQSTYDLLKNDPRYEFICSGSLVAKGKGEMEMYFVEMNTTKILESICIEAYFGDARAGSVHYWE